MVEEEAEEAGATAGSLKISAKKRRQVGSPLLVLPATLHSDLPSASSSHLGKRIDLFVAIRDGKQVVVQALPGRRF